MIISKICQRVVIIDIFGRIRTGWKFAEGGSRTHNLVRGSVFETDAYASSATSAEYVIAATLSFTAQGGRACTAKLA